MKNTLLIFGYGYTAKMLISKLDKTTWQIFATSRQPRYDDNSNIVEIIDFSKNAINRIINEVTHILVTTPPDTVLGDPTLLEFKEIIINKTPNLSWIGYLSATSVYGNHFGAWVDELTPVRIENERSRVRYEAELYWLALGRRINVPAQVFRLAGIYGPQRNPLCQLIENKAKVIYKKDQFFSRIHVEDIARVLIASMKLPTANEIYNLCDDLPSPTYEIVEYAATLLQIPVPDRILFENANLSEMAVEFYESNRRVRNSKIKDALSISLEYPTYFDGLRKMYNDGTF